MKQKHQLIYLFFGAFLILLILGPITQLLFIVNMPLHVSWGLSEPIVLEPAYGWFKADELAIAWADMTYLAAGVVFLIGSVKRRTWAIPFGFYTSACWAFIMLLARIRWPLLEANGFDVVSGEQETAFYIYAYVYILFGLFGMVYLWRHRNIYERD